MREFRPLFSVLLDTSLQHEGFTEDINRIGERLESATRLVKTQNLLSETIESTKTEERQKLLSFLMAMGYLCSVEQIAGAFVDLSILLLVSKGRNLHLEPDFNHRYTRHVRSLDDIESPNLPLSVKLDFLQSNGLTYYSKWVNRSLRNGIAHSDFDIDDMGNFFLLRKGKRKKVDLLRIHNTFLDYYNAMAAFFVLQVRMAFPKQHGLH